MRSRRRRSARATTGLRPPIWRAANVSMCRPLKTMFRASGRHAVSVVQTARRDTAVRALLASAQFVGAKSATADRVKSATSSQRRLGIIGVKF
jgi:hypothetical protein